LPKGAFSCPRSATPIGIQFPKDEKSAELRAKIENILGTALGSDKATQTV
jgi:type IV pilus assembly protein PilZ